MFKKFLNTSKQNEDELIKELLNPSFNLDKIDKIMSSLNVDLNKLYFDEELVFHICCKKDLFQAVLWFIDKKINLELENKEKETAIFYATQSKTTAIIQLLVENGINIDHLNIYKRTAIQDAVISANNRIVNYLIQVSSDLSNCDIHGNNLIFDAIANGSMDIIKKIGSIDKININQVNEDGQTIMHKESVLRNDNLAILLLELGADPTIPDKNGSCFLFSAISKGINSFEIIDKSIKLGHDINVRNRQKSTLLMESITHYLNTPKDAEELRFSHLEMIKELIRLGVNLNALDNKNENAFFLVTRSENKELIDIFLKKSNLNMNHNNTNGETVLSILALNGIRNKDLIDLYILNGANPSLENIFGQSLIEILIDIILHLENKITIEDKYIKLLNENAEYPTVLENILRTADMDMNKFNSKGEPLFFDSILNFNFKLFKVLRTKSVNINEKDKDGNNIIFRLMDYDNKNLIKDKKLYLNTIKSLINSGVDINAKNNESLTALHLAIAGKCEYTIRLLLEMRADCTITDTKGRTIMHTCIWKNTTRYFKLIYNYNKDIMNVPDSFGIRPINYAAFMGKKDLVIQMLDSGAMVNNPNKKDPKILEYLKKFHQNIINITDNIDKTVDQNSLQQLADNMIKEFNIKI
jgi:ankyrin repeat protein